MATDKTSNVGVLRWVNGKVIETDDTLLVEKPLTIKIDGEQFVTIMRTPGNERELAAGLLLAEGIIESRSDLTTIRFCPDEEDVVEVGLVPRRRKIAAPRIEAARGISRSSCGICGRKLIDETTRYISRIESSFRVESAELIRLAQDVVGAHQELFHGTGAAHSASLFDNNLDMTAFAEDVGRHNALDKAIGVTVLQPPEKRAVIAILSSRASFEMVQKAGAGGITVTCFVGAVTSMAVELAERSGVTLVGFLRTGRMNIYTHSERVIFRDRPV